MIREASSADIATIAELELELFGAEAWTDSALHDELGTAGRVLSVAEEDGEVVGYAVTMLAGELVDLERIGVRPERQRQGVARSLLDAALDQARSDGADRMLLEVSSENPEALAFYADMLFHRIDVRERYYRDGSDAVVMSRHLAGPGEGTVS